MMQNTTTKKLFRNSVFLSVLLHLLILLSLTKIVIFPFEKDREREEKSPQLYVPAYTYTGATKQAIQRTQPTAEAKSAQESRPVARDGINRPQPSVMDMSRNILRQDQVRAALSRPENEEPLLLVGDEHQTASPLVKLVGRSLSAHFHYPKMEGNFGIQGKVLVQFILHPEGTYSDVQIVRSSNNQNFDAAALYAVNTAPTLIGLDKLLKKPTYFVVGFIFD